MRFIHFVYFYSLFIFITYSVPLSEYITIYLSTQLLIDIWAVFSLGLLQMLLLWVFLCTFPIYVDTWEWNCSVMGFAYNQFLKTLPKSFQPGCFYLYFHLQYIKVQIVSILTGLQYCQAFKFQSFWWVCRDIIIFFAYLWWLIRLNNFSWFLSSLM